MIDYLMVVGSNCTIFGEDKTGDKTIKVYGSYSIGETTKEIKPHQVTPKEYEEMCVLLDAACNTFVNWRETRTYAPPEK